MVQLLFMRYTDPIAKFALTSTKLIIHMMRKANFPLSSIYLTRRR